MKRLNTSPNKIRVFNSVAWVLAFKAERYLRFLCASSILMYINCISEINRNVRLSWNIPQIYMISIFHSSCQFDNLEHSPLYRLTKLITIITRCTGKCSSSVYILKSELKRFPVASIWLGRAFAWKSNELWPEGGAEAPLHVQEFFLDYTVFVPRYVFFF